MKRAYEFLPGVAAAPVRNPSMVRLRAMVASAPEGHVRFVIDKGGDLYAARGYDYTCGGIMSAMGLDLDTVSVMGSIRDFSVHVDEWLNDALINLDNSADPVTACLNRIDKTFYPVEEGTR